MRSHFSLFAILSTMVLHRQKFREVVFQLLYSSDFSIPDEGEIVQLLMKELKVAKKNVLQAKRRAEEVGSKIVELDEKIRAASTEYAFERISRVEKNLLRLGLYEIFFDSEISPEVAIAEAIRLTRKFGTPESAHFVHAILDAVCKHDPIPTKPAPQ